MRLLTKLATKGWSQPEFWTLDRPIISSSWGDRERIAVDFERYVHNVYRADGVVFACIAARAMVFAQARFLWRRFQAGQPTELFGSPELGLIELPWPNASTGDLLTVMEQDVSMAGNFFGAVVGKGERIRQLRPDWVDVLTGSKVVTDPSLINRAPDATIIGYVYRPPGLEPIIYDPKNIIHYTEMPDPLYNWRGMSWLTPVIREIQGDMAATEHKLAFFKNGATPSMAIRYDASISKDAFEAFVERFKKDHERGTETAYRTLHLGGGADVTPLTMDFKQLDFKSTQGASETRIAAAAGAHPVIVGLSEGLSGSSLNAGNFQAARRLFVDGRIRFLWSKAAPALESVLPAEKVGARLWYDDRDIPFLRDDAMSEAQIRQRNAATIRQLIDAGFAPDVVVDAVTSGDLRRLRKSHSGLYSVQLQPIAEQPPSTEAVATEGGTS